MARKKKRFEDDDRPVFDRGRYYFGPMSVDSLFDDREALEREMFNEEEEDEDLEWLRRDEQHYEWQLALDKMIVNEIVKCQKDGRNVSSAMGAVKVLEKAKAALVIGMNARRVILGMNKDDAGKDDLPELVVQNLTKEQLEEIRQATRHSSDSELTPDELQSLEALAGDRDEAEDGADDEVVEEL